MAVSVLKKCNHTNTSNTGMCWDCLYQKSFNRCLHNNNTLDCHLCKLKLSNENKTKTCKHWVPINIECYICTKQKQQTNSFNHNLNNYVNPENINNRFSNINNGRNFDNKFKSQSDIASRDINNRERDSDGNINGFMKRSLETLGFIEENNNKNIWYNPISNTSIPTNKSFKMENLNILNKNCGINTRNNRKLDSYEDNSDLHLKRSLLQPDFREGNRFYEYKPTNTRRDSFRDINNQNARDFQCQSEKFYKDMDYTNAYDNAAGMNRK